jgi:aldose 1-epimerase
MPAPILNKFMLKNQNGMQVELCDFGARVLSIKVPDKTGKLIETTLNHKTDDSIYHDNAYMGATVGRTSNRISGSQFVLDGIEYQVSMNDGKNNLHGGKSGFSRRFWQTNGVALSGNSLLFSLISKDGDQGFPGEVNVEILFSLNESNELRFDFSATSTKPTPISFCNHAYFNMGESNINKLELSIHADAYLPADETGIPLGHFVNVADSRFDFKQTKVIENGLAHGVYDHCYRVTQLKMATLTSTKHGLRLELESDHVGMQFYSGNYLPIPQSAMCLEAQGYPNAMNNPELEQDILRPGKKYQKYVIYRFQHTTL